MFNYAATGFLDYGQERGGGGCGAVAAVVASGSARRRAGPGPRGQRGDPAEEPGPAGALPEASALLGAGPDAGGGQGKRRQWPRRGLHVGLGVHGASCHRGLCDEAPGSAGTTVKKTLKKVFFSILQKKKNIVGVLAFSTLREVLLPVGGGRARVPPGASGGGRGLPGPVHVTVHPGPVPQARAPAAQSGATRFHIQRHQVKQPDSETV